MAETLAAPVRGRAPARSESERGRLDARKLGLFVLCLVAVFLAFRSRFMPSLLWAVVGTLVVHVVFYKLLRVPLPWGVLRPLY